MRAGHPLKYFGQLFFVVWPPTLDFSLRAQKCVGSNPILSHLGSPRGGVGLDSSPHKLLCADKNLTLPCLLGRVESYLTHPWVEWGKILLPSPIGGEVGSYLSDPGYCPRWIGGAPTSLVMKGAWPTPCITKGQTPTLTSSRGEGPRLCIQGACFDPLATKGLVVPPSYHPRGFLRPPGKWGGGL